MMWSGFVLDMLRILVCISGRKSGWFLSEGEEGGGAGARGEVGRGGGGYANSVVIMVTRL